MRNIFIALALCLVYAAIGSAEEILIPGIIEVNTPRTNKRSRESARPAAKRPEAESKTPNGVRGWSDEEGDARRDSPPTPPAPAKDNRVVPPEAFPPHAANDLGEEQEIIPFPAAETISLPEDERPLAPSTSSSALRNEASLPATEKETSAPERQASSPALAESPSAPPTAAPSWRPSGAWDAPVARLDGENVGRAEFYRAMVEAHGQEILERFLNRILLKAELKRCNMTVTAAEIEQIFRDHLRRFADGESAQDPAALLRQETGMTIEDYKANVVWLEAAVRKLLKERFGVSEADIFNYYWMNRSQYTRPEMVRARHILIDPTQYAPARDGVRAVGPAEWAKALEKTLEIHNRLRSGLDFAEAARRFSHDRQTAEKGGDLGFFPRNAMVKPFSDAAFALKDGAISEPVKSIYGYHLIKVEERKAEQLVPFDQIQDKVRRDYEDYLVMSQAADLLTRLRQEAAASGRLQIFEEGLRDIGAQ